jgi:hypothetical protein
MAGRNEIKICSLWTLNAWYQCIRVALYGDYRDAEGYQSVPWLSSEQYIEQNPSALNTIKHTPYPEGMNRYHK